MWHQLTGGTWCPPCTNFPCNQYLLPTIIAESARCPIIAHGHTITHHFLLLSMTTRDRPLIQCRSSALCTLAVVESPRLNWVWVSHSEWLQKSSKIGRGARGPSINKPKSLLYHGNPILRIAKKRSKIVGVAHPCFTGHYEYSGAPGNVTDR